MATGSYMAMGQKPVLPVNIPIPTKIGSKMGGAPIPKWDPIGFDRPYGPIQSAFEDFHLVKTPEKKKNK